MCEKGGGVLLESTHAFERRFEASTPNDSIYIIQSTPSI